MPESTQVKLLNTDEETVTIGGYGVIFGGEDLEGEQFAADTDFMPELVPVKLVLYDHAMGEIKHVIGKASERLDEIGIWVEAQLDRSKEYVDAVLKLVEEGVLGWSSGSIGRLVERDGKNIKRWPIVEYSLTPTPAEPRTLGVERIKILAETNPDLEAFLPEDAGDASSEDATVEDVDAETQNKYIQLRARARLALTN